MAADSQCLVPSIQSIARQVLTAISRQADCDIPT